MNEGEGQPGEAGEAGEGTKGGRGGAGGAGGRGQREGGPGGPGGPGGAISPPLPVVVEDAPPIIRYSRTTAYVLVFIALELVVLILKL